MKVRELLPAIKANSNTYKGIDANCITEFRENYRYLVKHKEKEISQLGLTMFNEANGNDKFKVFPFTKKKQLMEIIKTSIIHS